MKIPPCKFGAGFCCRCRLRRGRTADFHPPLVQCRSRRAAMTFFPSHRDAERCHLGRRPKFCRSRGGYLATITSARKTNSSSNSLMTQILDDKCPYTSTISAGLGGNRSRRRARLFRIKTGVWPTMAGPSPTPTGLRTEPDNGGTGNEDACNS